MKQKYTTLNGLVYLISKLRPVWAMPIILVLIVVGSYPTIRADESDKSFLLREATITFLEEEMLFFQETEHVFSFQKIAFTGDMGYVEVLGSWEDEYGEDTELFRIYALFNEGKIQTVFREPSEEFFYYANTIPSDWLPQERLQGWLAT